MLMEQFRAFLAYLEARVNRALAYATAAFGSGQNTHETLFAIPVGPATQVTAISLPFTPKISGKVKVIAALTVTDAAVDDDVTFQIIQNPTSATGAPGGVALGSILHVDSGHVSGHATATPPVLAFNLPLNTPATFGITAKSVGNNLTTVSGILIIEELPG